jgi:vitamin B12 transporter
LFDNRVRDLIVIDPVSFATMINLPATHTRGLELRWAGRLGPVDVVAQATFQDPVDRDTDRLLPRRAREFGSVVATLPWGRWRAGFEAIASGARFDRAGEPAAHRMAGYAIVNARLSYALDRDWTIDARWNNLFDRDYELVQHYRVPRSHLFVALRYQPR